MPSKLLQILYSAITRATQTAHLYAALKRLWPLTIAQTAVAAVTALEASIV